MKNTFVVLLDHRILVPLLVILSLNSCISSSRLFVEEDIIYSSKRAELRYTVKDQNLRSPLNYLRQSIVKNISANQESSYTAYDILYMSSSSFKLEDKVFLIIDGEPFQMTLSSKELDTHRSISEDKTSVLASDSTSISVTTGYSENNSKIVRISYNISGDIISKIKSSNQIMLRYYSGPSMITVRMGYQTLKKLKHLIDLT